MAHELPAGPAIGIDLGTTYSCVAVFEHGMVEIIANDMGNRTTPSYVAFTDTERLVGDAAKVQAAQNPENTVFDAKRLIGRGFMDPNVKLDAAHFPFAIVNDNGKPSIEVKYKNQKKRFCPEEISSMILTKMKQTAEAYLNAKVTDAVITVPAYFNDSQRQATKDAGAIAGLNVLRIINEPTAAAIAYGFDKKSAGEKNILIFDLGGGTFDVSILTIDDGVFEVKSTSGDTHLGGEDFDSRLVTFMASEFKRKHGKDLTGDKRALRRLRIACEQAKRTLSSASQTQIQVPSLFNGIDFNSSITRAKFEDLCADLFASTLEPVKQALKFAEFKQSDIHEVILVGGSTRIPKVQRLLQDYFGGKELNTSINPDEAVAYGAAVQAALIRGDEASMLQELLLLDVTPLNLGIETRNGEMSCVVEANSTIPQKETKGFTTMADYQSKILIAVYQGNRPMIIDNQKLGEFTLDGIAKQLRGVPKIDVTFELDVNGILHVSAKDLDTGSQNEILISSEAGRLTNEQIAQMKHDAEAFQEEDQKAKATCDARNDLDLYAYQMQSTVTQAQNRGQISGANYQRVSDSAEGALKWLNANKAAKLEDIVRKKSELKRVCDPIVTRLFA